MEFLKQIAEQADKIEHARLYEGVEQTLEEAFDAVVALILESEGSKDQELAEKACTVLMKDKQDEEKAKGEEEEEEPLEQPGDEDEEAAKKAKKKKGPSLKEAMDSTYQGEVDLLASLKTETIEAAYAKITESFDSCVDKILKNDKNLKKDGKATRKEAAEAIAATAYRKMLAKKGKGAK